MSPVTAGDPRPLWARLNRRCLLGAFGCIACGVVSVIMIVNALQAPETGTDARGMAVASGVVVVAASTVGAVALIIAAILRRAPSHPPAPTAGWYADPSNEGTWRFWDGHSWTNRVA